MVVLRLLVIVKAILGINVGVSRYPQSIGLIHVHNTARLTSMYYLWISCCALIRFVREISH